MICIIFITAISSLVTYHIACWQTRNKIFNQLTKEAANLYEMESDLTKHDKVLAAESARTSAHVFSQAAMIIKEMEL